MGVLGAWAVFIKAFAVRLAHKTHLGLVVSKYYGLHRDYCSPLNLET